MKFFDWTCFYVCGFREERSVRCDVCEYTTFKDVIDCEFTIFDHNFFSGFSEESRWDVVRCRTFEVNSLAKDGHGFSWLSIMFTV